ncbi:hypothetical protein ACFLU4_08885, partial [Chloroflexota bacterium]
EPEFDFELSAMNNVITSAVEIRTKSRGTYKRRVDDVKGNPQNPLSWEEASAKFRDCARFAAKPLPQKSIDEVIRLVHNLEEVHDVAEIVELLS